MPKTAEERAEERAAKKALTAVLGMLVQVDEGATAKQIAATTGIAQGEVQKVLAALVKDGKAVGEKPPGSKVPTVYSLVPDPDAPDPALPRERRTRNDGEKARGRGELGQQVHAVLSARPGESLGPVEVAKFLGGASVGAVTNALVKFTADGGSGITQVQDKPKRFAYTA